MARRPSKQSRRDFLATSALGLAGLATGATRPTSEQETQPGGHLLYVGTYTEKTRSQGIYVLRMDARSGELRQIGAFDGGPNPSFLTVHPNGRLLYAVNEVTEQGGKQTGGVTAFAIARDSGALTRLNQQASHGGAPCYVTVDRSGRVVLVANYVGGNVALLPIHVDGSLAPATHVVQHTGKGPNTQRQEGPHAHYIMPDPSNRFALVADLGIDRVLVYRLDLERRELRHVEGADGVMKAGAGPRHIAFDSGRPLVFVANELDSTVAALRFDRETGMLSPVSTHSTLPAGWSGTNYPADIHVAPSGRTVYVSNRGLNSIAVFTVADPRGTLSFDQTISTEGEWPRNFTLDPTGSWLLVANQRSDSITVFARNPQSGRLTRTHLRLAIPSPVCLRFHAHR